MKTVSDELLCPKGQLITIASRPGIGKSSLLEQLCIEIPENLSMKLDEMRMSTDEILNLINSCAGLKMVTIDYVQLIPGLSEKGRGFLQTLKVIALERKINIVIASQLGRADEKAFNYRPSIKDFRNDIRDIILEFSDQVVLINRPSFYSREDSRPEVEFIIHKNQCERSIRAYFFWNEIKRHAHYELRRH